MMNCTNSLHTSLYNHLPFMKLQAHIDISNNGKPENAGTCCKSLEISCLHLYWD